MGKTKKKLKENHATKVTKIPKTKRGKYERDIRGINLTDLADGQTKLTKWHVPIPCSRG